MCSPASRCEALSTVQHKRFGPVVQGLLESQGFNSSHKCCSRWFISVQVTLPVRFTGERCPFPHAMTKRG